MTFAASLRSLFIRQNYTAEAEHETNSEAEETWAAEDTGAMLTGGHSIPVFVGYGVNAARNNGADIEPIPITPVRQQNWPEMQIQLRNGWETTSMGKKISYDDYLRLMTDSGTKNRNYLIPKPSGLGPSAGKPGPAPSNVANLAQMTAGNQPTAPGGPGMIAGNVNLSGRTYFG